ncbi:hypothetical protein [Marinicellulosiphila megalodicopiae]|uniref:hypothetical protein n=1 Tax=Marinicellulosiphila megalodicopiae TaxID=2724896 RepID=UPI003BB03ED4
MSKTVRKLNDKLVGALKILNEFACEELVGFKKLEHTVAFDLFPGSLLVTCYFEDQAALDNSKKDKKIIQKKLVSLLLKQGIVLKDVKQNLAFAVSEL